MQKSPNFLKHQSNPQAQSLNQSSNLANIAYYQADFWLMLLSTFVASFSFWVLAEISLSAWQLYGFVALFLVASLLTVNYGQWIGAGLLGSLLLLLMALNHFLLPWVETQGGYDGAIFLLILTSLLIFKLIHFAQTKMRQRFLIDHPLGHHNQVCHICQGEGILDSFQEYLEKKFVREICYGCNGEGIIADEHFAYPMQDLLNSCEQNRRELEKIAHHLENLQEQILQKLSVKEGVLEPTVQQHLQESSQAYGRQLKLTQKQVVFYKTSEEKIHIVLYNHHVAETLLTSQKNLENIQQQHEKHHRLLDLIQLQLAQEKELNTDTEALSIEYELNTPATTENFDTIVQKIEEATRKIQAL